MTLPIRLFTLCHNGMPFIKHHLRVFEELKRPWSWSIFEGITPIPAWFNKPGRITEEMHRDGLSTDGTHEYLMLLAQQKNITVRCTNDQKLYLTERCQHMLADLTSETIVVQIDVDEFWTTEQLETLATLFENNPHHNTAMFYCRYFVGPDRCLEVKASVAGNQSYEWFRAWRWTPGCKYVQHDPPRIQFTKSMADVLFGREITQTFDLVFDHYAYILEEQVRFKETRYGFKGSLEGWKKLQSAELPVDVHNYLPWLGHGMVEQAPSQHVWK